MRIQCKTCKATNYNDSLLCINCSEPLWDKSETTEILLNRISRLEKKHHQEIQALKKDIYDFNKIKDLAPKQIVISENKFTEIKEEVVGVQSKDINTVIQLKDKQLEFKLNKTKNPSRLHLKIKELLGFVNEGVELFFDAYVKYKKEGKLPIFFMTIAGIMAILFGFGYLMQLSVRYLGVYQMVAKIGVGFTSSIGLVVIGIRLSRKEKTLKEYGSSLISLGIILNYLMIYFMSDLGSFSVLSSGILGFILICINTIISIYFSLKYDAKVISVISLIGGAFAPLYLNAMSDGTLYYLYLWFLALGSCYVSKKKNWEKLNYLTFAVVLGSLQFMVFNHSPSSIIYAIYYHLFAYLFFFVPFFDGFKLKNKIVKSDIIILASSLSFFLYNLYSAFESNPLRLGIVYTLNGFVFSSLLVMKWKDLNRDFKLILFVVIGALVGVAIPSVFDQELMGLFWSIEALLLVILGFNFSILSVRKEGYILLAIAFGKLILNSLSVIENWDETLWHQGFLNYMVLGAVFTSVWFIGRKHNKKLTGFEKTLYTYIQEIVPLWLASVFIILGYQFIGEWIFNLSVIPLFGFVYWKKHFKTKLSDLIGLSHLLLFIVGILISIQTTDSFRFLDQKLYAQIAFIELMATLWVIKYFYQSIKIKDSNTYSFTQNLRILFFCVLPLVLLNFIRRNAFEYIELGLWFATLITYFLFKKLKFRALKLEFYILSIISFFVCYIEWDSVGLISGIAFIVITVLVEKAIRFETFQTSSIKQYIMTLPFVLTILIGSFIFSLDDNFIALSLSISSFSLLTLAYFHDKISPVKENYKLAIKIGLLLNLCSILLLLVSESVFSMTFSIINLIIISLLLSNKKKWFPVLYGKHWNGTMVIHQIECVIVVAIIVEFLGFSITGPLYSILLATHAIIVLFIAMKNQIKVLNKISIVLFVATLIKVVFYDINDIHATQKVIVLIVLGMILLSASYGYVKLAKHFEKKLKTVQEKKNETKMTNSTD